MSKATCESCRFLADGRYGSECRRYPPTVTREGAGQNDNFPGVAMHWWCGEHKPKPTEKAGSR